MTARSPHSRAGPRAVLSILATAALAYSFMQTLVLPALPSFQEAFGASPTQVAWIASAFFLSSSICIPVVGRLGDTHGKVRVLTLAMAVFGLATVAAALAPNLEVLIACRVVQGVGGAVFPLAFAIVSDELPAADVPFGIGVVSSIFGIGSGLGFVMSGVVLELLSWRWLFGLAALPALATVLLLPRLPGSSGHSGARPDWPGAALLSLGLLAMLVAVSEGNNWGWSSPEVLLGFAGGATVLVLWTRFERRAADPMVDLDVVGRPPMSVLNAATFLIGYAMFAVFTVLPGFVAADPAVAGYGFAASPIAVGVFFLPMALAMLVAGPAAGAARRPPLTVLRIGVAALTVALGLLAVARGEQWMIYAWMALVGVGSGSCLAVLGRLVVEAVPAGQSGVAGAVNTIARTIGGAVAGQAGAAMVTAFVLDSGVPAARGYTTAFAVAAGCGLAALAVTVRIERAPARARQPLEPLQASEPPSIR
jgi:MFS family permease